MEQLEISYEEIAEKIAKLKFSQSSRVVFTNGCFDILHSGHIAVLKKCRELAGMTGIVVVGVNSDESIKRLKGESRPAVPSQSRVDVLMSMRFVDFVVMFDEDTPQELIDALKPDVIVKGSDYKEKHVVGSDTAAVVYVDIVDDISTTSIIERIKKQ